MGKRIIPQRRGRGGSHYRSPSHRHLGKVRHPQLEGEGIVVDLMHSPAHTSPVAIVKFDDKSVYMLACEGLELNQRISVGTNDIAPGNVVEIGTAPEGTQIFNIEIKPGDGGKLVRSAGGSALIISQGSTTVIKMPSGQYKELNPRCRACVGIVAGSGHVEKPFAKAGKKYHTYRSRAKAHLKVRGVAMNPVAHPHGGGSHQHIGRPSTVSSHSPPGRKVGRLAPKKKRRK